jgi:hypothetical protein
MTKKQLEQELRKAKAEIHLLRRTRDGLFKSYENACRELGELKSQSNYEVLLDWRRAYYDLKEGLEKTLRNSK